MTMTAERIAELAETAAAMLSDEWVELCRLAAIGLRAESARIAWAGHDTAGHYHASTDWKDAAHVALHLSGFGDAEEQAKVKAHRVRIVPVDGEQSPR